jgi:hypothetical protein
MAGPAVASSLSLLWGCFWHRQEESVMPPSAMAECFVLQEFMNGTCNVVYPNGIAETLFQQGAGKKRCRSG